MIEFNVLKIVWWMIVGGILMTYASTAGYDLGITMILPFLKDERDKRVALNVSAPTWDGNQSWIIFAGGALFVVWPLVYSTAFSGIYAGILCILWGFFLRPPGYDYRSKIDNALWRRFWDFGLFISSVLPVLIFGVIFGNCLVGYPFHFDPLTMRSFYTGNFLGLLNVFGVGCGIVSLIMILMHGSAYLARRTEDNLQLLARRIHAVTTIVLVILFTVLGILLFNANGYILKYSPNHAIDDVLGNLVVSYKGAWVDSYNTYHWKYYGPIGMYVGAIISLWGNAFSWYTTCFWGSVMCVCGVIATGGLSLFPFLMPSSTNPDESITVWNAASTQYALNIMLYFAVILFTFITVYKIFSFYTIWQKKGTLSRQDVEENNHSFY